MSLAGIQYCLKSQVLNPARNTPSLQQRGKERGQRAVAAQGLLRLGDGKGGAMIYFGAWPALPLLMPPCRGPPDTLPLFSGKEPASKPFHQQQDRGLAFDL